MSKAEKSCQVVFRTTPSVRQRLERMSKVEDRSLSNVIHRLLVVALEERNGGAHPPPGSKPTGKGRRI